MVRSSFSFIDLNETDLECFIFSEGINNIGFLAVSSLLMVGVVRGHSPFHNLGFPENLCSFVISINMCISKEFNKPK